jgi:uncharacterized protein YgiM (DUF1202 family)
MTLPKPLFTALFCLFTAVLVAQSTFYSSEMVVTASSLKLRKEASTQSAALETIPRGTIIEVIGTHNDGEVVAVDTIYAPWYKVRFKGKEGYVFGAFVQPTYTLYYELEPLFEREIHQLNYYGIYRRDSFSDEVRKIKVRFDEQYSEMHDMKLKVLKTDQKDTSKFIIATPYNLPTGYAGPLGITDSPGWFFEGGLAPGDMQSISVGFDDKANPPVETVGQSYFVAATGCAALKGNFVQVSGYQLQVFEMDAGSEALLQNLTPLVTPEPGINPQVSVSWYGDLDHDNKPDMLLHDCPVEMGCRVSLFLSSKARTGELLHKMSEYFWYAD